jgi:hypothetical protein
VREFSTRAGENAGSPLRGGRRTSGVGTNYLAEQAGSQERRSDTPSAVFRRKQEEWVGGARPRTGAFGSQRRIIAYSAQMLPLTVGRPT